MKQAINQADVKSSGKESTPAPKVTSGSKGFDQFVREALQSAPKPKK